MTTRNDTEMQFSRRKRRPGHRKSTNIDRKKVAGLVENEVKISISKMEGVTQLDNIVVESFDVDSWGGIPVYLVKGYIEAQVKTGLLSTRSGEKRFYATVKAETGEFLAIHWEPGKVS